ncbi:spore germination protein GerPE [Halobacillus litoralis]|uniref:Spore germination protein GerPE n=1 Tax=Halobacillus litoralis TaxID=45668 RepID=A0A845F8K9_9BACI|nr:MULTISPECIES: spore germination protein GerPE [Halobacillus]MEC3883717.1 spore germination protein GerPE [Halobacillus sp. HZG1]MYL70229.1 spore germination protein GerPE [Halobacillus litoralis]
MIKRMVYSQDVDITSVLIGSIVDIGDVYRAAPSSKVLAVQKEGLEFKADIYDFEDFPIFSQESSPPLSPVQIDSFFYQNRPIVVDHVRVIGVSTAGVFQIGGIDHIDAINYTKHFRILENEEQ